MRGKMPDGADRVAVAQPPRSIAVASDKSMPATLFLGESFVGRTTRTSEVRESSKVDNQKNGLVSNPDELPKEKFAFLVKDFEDREQTTNIMIGSKF